MTVLLALSLANPAAACSLAAPPTLPIDASRSDGQGPAAPAVEVASIKRGVGPTRVLGGMQVTSCDDIGWIELRFDPAGDASADGGLGFVFDVAEGAGEGVPEGLTLWQEPVVGGSTTLSWIDGATDDQEPLDFTLLVTAVDAGGDEGETVEVHVLDGGGTAGCSHTPGSAGGLALLVGGLLFRRRR